MTFNHQDNPAPALNVNTSTASPQHDASNKSTSAHGKKSDDGHLSSPPLFHQEKSAATNEGDSENDFDWDDLPPPSRRPSAMRLSSPSTKQDVNSRTINKTLKLILKRISELDSKLETHTDCVESAFRGVYWHIHELGTERKKADAIANKLRKSIGRLVTNIIDKRIEDNDKMERPLSDSFDMEAEDIAEVRQKVGVASKIQVKNNRKVNDLIDLIIEEVPDILEERGFLCRCRCTGSDHGITARDNSVPSIPHSRPHPINSILDSDSALARLGRSSFQRGPDGRSRVHHISLPTRRPDSRRAYSVARDSDVLLPLEVTSPRCGSRKEPLSVRSKFLKAFVEDDEDQYLLW